MNYFFQCTGEALTSPMAADSVLSNVKTRVSIAVSCANATIVQSIISAKRKIGNHRFSMLDALQPSSALSSLLSLNNDFNLYVNELLFTKTCKSIGKARSTLERAGLKYIWSKTGVVHVKRMKRLRHIPYSALRTSISCCISTTKPHYD